MLCCLIFFPEIDWFWYQVTPKKVESRYHFRKASFLPPTHFEFSKRVKKNCSLRSQDWAHLWRAIWSPSRFALGSFWSSHFTLGFRYLARWSGSKKKSVWNTSRFFWYLGVLKNRWDKIWTDPAREKITFCLVKSTNNRFFENISSGMYFITKVYFTYEL